MFDKPQATHTFGLDIDSRRLKGAALVLLRGKPKLEALFECPLEELPTGSENVKPLYTDSQKSQLTTFAKRHLVVTCLSTQEVLVRPLELKVKKEKDVDAVLLFQAEPILPYPIDNAVVDKITLAKDKEGRQLTIFAARKDRIALHLKQWNALEIEPEVISAAPHALALFAQYFSAAEGYYYLLHIGEGQSLCLLLNQGKLIAAQAIPLGLLSLGEALAQETGEPLDQTLHSLNERQFVASDEKPPTPLNSAVEALRLAVTRTIYALAKQVKGREVNALMVTGPGAKLSGLTETLCRPLNKNLLPLQVPNTFGCEESQVHDYALAIGAALTALPTSKEQINFRQAEYAYPAPWKRLKQPIAIYLGLCMAAAIALMLFGKAYVLYQEAEIKQEYLDLLNVMGRPYAAFEREFTSKVPLERELAPGEVSSVADLTPAEIQNRLNYLEKEIQSTPQIFPLLPNVPLVSDVLAWLSTHANFVAKHKDSEPEATALQVESFSYTMVKRPEPSKKQEKYQVKVEIEFSSPTPKMAREFHDALIAPNDLVDPKAEIKWNSNRDKYRTSFFLKDKTTYTGS